MHFLITAGGTREYIDPVRFISNASSGKMGYALAQAAFQAGHKVTLISASYMQPPVGVDFVGIDSASKMFEAVKKYLKKCDCLIMASAVSDYTPARVSKTKIKKGCSELTIKLKPTKDILAWAGKNKKKNQILVGFALEDKAIRQNAQKKMKQKNLDMIVANAPEAIAADKSTAHIKTPDSKWVKVENKDKATIAKKIITMVENI
jgi:phosphopantothenoylcysteine synthetase/decarboxylase